MSKKKGYSIRYSGDGFCAMTVSRQEKYRWRIEQLEQNKAEEGPSASLAKILDKNSDSLTMVVDGSEVTTSLVTLPKLKKKQMGLAAVGWVARTEATPADQWAVNWSERPRLEGAPGNEQSDVFLLYAQRSFVEQQQALPLKWGVSPNRMVPDFLALENMFRRYGPGHDELEAWNVVFVDGNNHFLCISTPSGLIMTRPLPEDLSNGADGDEYLARLATEVDRSIFFARQTEYNPNIQRIVVCGDSVLAQGLVERLKDETSVPAEFWDVSSLFDFEGGNLNSSLFLPAMAAVMATKPSKSNLLPKKSKSLFNPVVRRRLLVASSTAAAVVVPILAVGGFLTSSIQDQYLEKAHRHLDEAQILADEATQIYVAQKVLQAKEEHIRTAKENERDFAGVLLHLASLTPGEIIFKDLRLKENSSGELVLQLIGVSNSQQNQMAQQAFVDFQKALDDSEILKATGEPRKLVIAAETDEGKDIKKVEFSMEYRVDTQSAGHSKTQEVAVVAARTEG
ncbi:MAG: hypothetical protein GY780_12655 [bacterium]|nr:hypothetical protein [bacterium]